MSNNGIAHEIRACLVNKYFHFFKKKNLLFKKISKKIVKEKLRKNKKHEIVIDNC